LRGLVTRGFIKLGGATALASAGILVWLVLSLDGSTDVGGYLLDGRYLNPIRAVSLVMLVLLAAYTVLVWRERRPDERIVGGACGLAAIAAVALTAGYFRLPAWGYPGVLLSLLLGALSLG